MNQIVSKDYYEIKQYHLIFKLFFSGDFELPEGYQVRNFSVHNSTLEYRDRYIFQHKEHQTFLSAFRDAYRKIQSKPNRYSYKIELSYKTDSGSVDYLSICYVIKKENGEFAIHTAFSDFDIPQNWLPKSKGDNKELDSLIEIFKTKYNVKEIVFRSSISKKKKVEFLRKIENYFHTLEKLINFHSFPPSIIATSNMSKWGGTYDRNHVINLIIGKEYAFYHEYFHHLDLGTYHMRKSRFDAESKIFIEETKAGELYLKWCDKLLNTDTMQRFISWNKYLLNEHGAVKPSKSNTKEGKHYIYWTSYDEMTARFFSDYMFYFHFDELISSTRYYQENKTRDYTIEELESIKSFMIEFLNELTVLSRDNLKKI